MPSPIYQNVINLVVSLPFRSSCLYNRKTIQQPCSITIVCHTSQPTNHYKLASLLKREKYHKVQFINMCRSHSLCMPRQMKMITWILKVWD